MRIAIMMHAEEFLENIEIGNEVSFVASDSIAYDMVIHQNGWEYNFIIKS
jgi:hypothetical protein